MPLSFWDFLILPTLASVVVFLYVWLFRWRKKRAHQFSKNQQFLENTGRNRFAYSLYVASISLALVFLYLAWFMPSFYRDRILIKPILSHEEIQSQAQNFDEVVFAVDVSASMDVSDASENKTRLLRAKEIIKSVTEAFSGIHISLVAFQGDAVLQVPKTLDYFFFWIVLDTLSGQDTKSGGTSLINLKQFIEKQYGGPNQVSRACVILLTDGEDTALMNNDLLLTKSAEEKIVSAFGSTIQQDLSWQFVGVGSVKGGVVPDLTYDQKNVTSKMRRNLLNELAKATDGAFLDDNSYSLFEMTNALISNIAPDLSVHPRPLVGYPTTKEAQQKIQPEEIIGFTTEVFLIALILLLLPLFIHQRRRAHEL